MSLYNTVRATLRRKDATAILFMVAIIDVPKNGTNQTFQKFPKYYNLPIYRMGQMLVGEIGSKGKRANPQALAKYRLIYGEVVAINPLIRGDSFLDPERTINWLYSLRPLRVLNAYGGDRGETHGLYEVQEHRCNPVTPHKHNHILIPADFEKPKFTLGVRVKACRDRSGNKYYRNSGVIIGVSYIEPGNEADCFPGWYYTLLVDDTRLDVYQDFHESELSL